MTRKNKENEKKKKKNQHKGVYKRKYPSGGISYGIDYIHPITGQRIKKILKGVTSETDALKLRNIELTDAERGAIDKAYGLKAKTNSGSFEHMVSTYLKWSEGNKKSWKTDYDRAKPLRKAFKGKQMPDINTFVIEKYKMARAKVVAKVTVNKELILGSQVLKKAIEWKKYNGDNPFVKADKFKIKKAKKPGSLTPDQVTAIMNEIGHPVKRDMVEFDFNTGWRISEVRKLKKLDVDLEACRAWIMDPKNWEPVEIDLNDAAVQILDRNINRSKGEYVFCHLNGKPFKTNLYDVFKRAAVRAGITLPPRKAWHILRRTWASMFLQSGGDTETLRELGNWKDYSMPMWYADAGNSAHKRKVLNRIPKLGKKEENGTKMELAGKVVQLNGTND